MCLIVAQETGAAAFAADDMALAWQCNSDGAGYMFCHEGRLYIRKPFFKLKDLKAEYYKDHAKYSAASPFVLHFRLATHGARKGKNTHPFRVDHHEIGMAHNGILWTDTGSNQSDSRFFIETVLVARSSKQIMSATFCEILADMIGGFNKLVFLSGDGTLSIVNEKLGWWDTYEKKGAGTWFSNSVWLERWNVQTKYQSKKRWKNYVSTSKDDGFSWDDYCEVCGNRLTATGYCKNCDCFSPIGWEDNKPATFCEILEVKDKLKT